MFRPCIMHSMDDHKGCTQHSICTISLLQLWSKIGAFWSKWSYLLQTWLLYLQTWMTIRSTINWSPYKNSIEYSKQEGLQSKMDTKKTNDLFFSYLLSPMQKLAPDFTTYQIIHILNTWNQEITKFVFRCSLRS